MRRSSVSWEEQEPETDARIPPVYGTCGKRSYPSIRQARYAHLRVNNRIRVYWCEGCQAFHVTDQEYR